MSEPIYDKTPPDIFTQEHLAKRKQIRLFGSIPIGGKFKLDGSEYIKLAVDVGRKIYKEDPNMIHYQQFSDATEVET